MEIERSEKLGRKVDLRTAADLSRYFRDEVVAQAEVHYAKWRRGPVTRYHERGSGIGLRMVKYPKPRNDCVEKLRALTHGHGGL